MTSSTIPKQELKDLLAKNETLRTIEILRASPTIQGDQENSRTVDLQSSRYHQVEAAYHKGTLSPQERNTEMLRLSNALLQLIDQLSEEALAIELPPLPANLKRPEHPFTGLHWFTREDAPVFFGRGKDIRELYDYIIEGERLILLYGQSGAGKSSLLHAGLLPRLEHAWHTVYAAATGSAGCPTSSGTSCGNPRTASNSSFWTRWRKSSPTPTRCTRKRASRWPPCWTRPWRQAGRAALSWASERNSWPR